MTFFEMLRNVYFQFFLKKIGLVAGLVPFGLLRDTESDLEIVGQLDMLVDSCSFW